MTYTKHTLERHDAQISYARFGDPSGTPLILLQGLGMPGSMWYGLGESLAGEDFHVTILDNRGTGGSRSRKALFGMKDMADDVAAVHEEVFGQERALLAGISMGGMISQHVALRHSERLRGVVLAATTCGLPHNLMHGAFVSPRALALLLKLCFTPHRTGLDDMRRLLLHPDSAPRQEELFGRIQDVFREQPTPSSTYARQLLAALRHSTGKELPGVDLPVHVITGDSDHLIPTRNADLLASKLPNSWLTVVPSAGHAFPLEHPRAFIDAIISLRERVSSNR